MRGGFGAASSRNRGLGSGLARGESKNSEGGGNRRSLRHMAGDDGESSVAGYSESDVESNRTNRNSYHHYGPEIAGAGGSEAWARVRGRGRGARHQARIRPTLERGASPGSTPRDASGLPSGMASVEDSGLEGVEFLSSPGGTGSLFDGFCSPLSEGTGAGGDMPLGGWCGGSMRR